MVDETARLYIEQKFARLLDEAERLGIMFHVLLDESNGRIIYSNEMNDEDFPVVIEIDEDAADPAFRKPELDREAKILECALSYAHSNFDDLNEVLETDFTEYEIEQLLGAYRPL